MVTIGRRSDWFRRVALLTFVAFVLACGLFAQAPGTARQYRLTPIPLKPTGISETGMVIGTVEGGHAAVWSKSKGLVLIPETKGFAQSEARGINRRGDVVGFQSKADRSGSLGFLYERGKVMPLQGRNARAFAINDRGEIVGEAVLPGKGPVTPVLWRANAVRDLGGCCGGTAKAINTHGSIVGDVYDDRGRYRAFVWESARGLRALGADAQEAGDPNYTSAIAINEKGHILIQQPARTLTLYREKTQVIVKVSDKYPVDARSMNSKDEIVGAFGPFYDADRAFLWDESHGARDLNDLVQGNSGWKLEMATGINDAGQIAGFGDHQGEEDSGFLLEPQGP